ncbi:hypothetical protein G6045_34920 [Streptomyces sp. YC504]|uniref:Uncharacterized protein n=1 Tax=Streptomyces mesophilus TaxID=1775132 RepID=A0A6G4XUC2_9ACTN|nr:hypothetical protein [Streptomyces mesophilus]NGO80813.1 hypothetical protein [Streptomyces mesophilus]
MLLIGMLLLLALALLSFAALAFLGYLLLMVVLSVAAGTWTRPRVGWALAAVTIGLPLALIVGGAILTAG